MKKTGKRMLGVLLAAVMLLGLFPALTPSAEASSAGQYLEVYLGNGRIGNGGYGETDLFVNFVANTGAFTYTTEGGDHALNGNSFRMGRPSDRATFTVTIANNELLKTLSQSSSAQYKVVGKMTGTDDDFHGGTLHDDNDRARLRVADSRRGTYKEHQSDKEEDAEDTVTWLDTDWQSLTGLSWIKLYADNRHYCDGDYSYSDNCEGDSYVEMWLYIRDTSGPALTNYTTSTNATVNSNNNTELLVKLGIKNPSDPDSYYYDFKTYVSDSNAMASREYIGFQFNFSKPVSLSSYQGGNLVPVSNDDYDPLASHQLFTNTQGTGYLNQGENRMLKLEQSKEDLQGFRSSISYRYIATYGDFSGNNPIPDSGRIESGSNNLLSRINSAGFHDAAGNPLTGVDGSKGNNIFDKNDGGYDVIVDAVPPTYTKTGNGVMPDILTQLVLNENDTVDFIVSFSEAVITKRGWDNDKTYLMLNNGDRAYFKSKSTDGKQWVFTYTFKAGAAEEASLLKVIALANDSLDGSLQNTSGRQSRANDSAYTFNVDGRTITDYVGNMMVERANEDSSTNTSQIQSSIGWASLMVDNTCPNIGFSYKVYGTGTLSEGTDSDWGQAAKVMISASDPNVPVAQYDPDYSASNTERPSKGIYRPDNTTGSTGSAVGLVYYIWTRSITPPDTGENYAAIKRYAMTGEQPAQVTGSSYAASWAAEEYNLVMANNYSDIVPPDAAMTGAGDGAWYLHAWTADMTWDSARQLMQYEKANALQYNSGYNNAEYLALKQSSIETYRKNNTSGANTPSYDVAWEAVKKSVYEAAFTAQFLAWLDESGSDRYSDAAMIYARSQAMLKLADYADTEVWPLTDYSKSDSNWTHSVTRLLLDNTAPAEEAVYRVVDMIGDGTASVELPFTVSDGLSGIDVNEVYYQWVLLKDDGSQTYDEVQWLNVTPDSTTAMTDGVNDGLTLRPTYGEASVTCTAVTIGNVIEDGTYILYLKYSDMAGNTTVTDSGDVTVKVDSSNGFTCTFGPASKLDAWTNSVTPAVLVKGVAVGKLVYAVTGSAERPADGFIELEAETADQETRTYSYLLPALDDEDGQRADGMWYVHILVYENADQTVEPHYYRQLYRLDRTDPEITVNPDGFSQFAQDSVNAAVTVSDNLAGVKAGTVYRISAEAQEIGEDEEGWLTLPENGLVTLSSQEDGEFYLHVRASDEAGNTVYRVSGAFSLRGTAEPSVLPPYSCQILATYTQDGANYAVANLDLGAADKKGYRYSISTNGGETWCNWLPYMSMISIKLPASYGENSLQVKFRSPDGIVGTPKNIVSNPNINAIWVTARFDSVLKRQTGKTLTILMNLPENVTAEEKVEEGEAARTTKLDNGNFTVTANGVYTFRLKRGNQTSGSDFVVVVDIFDDTPPVGYISYSELAPTNASVIATVKANEGIYVKSLKVTYVGEAEKEESPKQQFAFKKNGTAVFTIVDEAGNESTVTATVSNIDTDAPNVRINTSYDLYRTVGEGDALIASGATLEVGKTAPNEEDFVVVSNDRYPTMEIGENGEYSFIVQDRVGNVTLVSHTVGNIVTTLPDYTVTYAYADGSPVRDGEWKQGKVVATVTFNAVTDGRKLYGGASIVDEVRNVVEWNDATNTGETVQKHISNELGASGGRYVYARTYSANGETALVVCDSLGNVERIPISVTGIDNTAPSLKLNKETVVISNDQTKRLSQLTQAELEALFGGYSVTDNAYTAGFTVTVARSDDEGKPASDRGKLNEVGKFTLVYTVSDPAGNVSYTEQTLIVIPADGLLIEAGRGNDFSLLSSLAANSSILPDNHVTFRIDQTRMQTMFFNNYGQSDGTKKVQNTEMRYDIFYVSGLYREGQLKTIATQITSEQLTSQSFNVTFPKAGWYTIIIRNQERTREYTTFFIAATSN